MRVEGKRFSRICTELNTKQTVTFLEQTKKESNDEKSDDTS